MSRCLPGRQGATTYMRGSDWRDKDSELAGYCLPHALSCISPLPRVLTGRSLRHRIQVAVPALGLDGQMLKGYCDSQEILYTTEATICDFEHDQGQTTNDPLGVSDDQKCESAKARKPKHFRLRVAAPLTAENSMIYLLTPLLKVICWVRDKKCPRSNAQWRW